MGKSVTRESFYPARPGCLRGRDVLTELPIPVATHSDGRCRNLCRTDGRRAGRYCWNSDRLAVVVASSGQSDLVDKRYNVRLQRQPTNEVRRVLHTVRPAGSTEPVHEQFAASSANRKPCFLRIKD